MTTVPKPRDAVPVQPATADQLEQTESRIDERMSAFERSMLRLTSAGVVIGVITGLIFLGQLYEMIEGGTQTDKLVQYAKTQAGAATQMATASDKFSTTAQTAVTEFKKAAGESTNAAKEGVANTKMSIKNAQESFHDDQRAWVGVLDAVPIDFSETQPLTATIIYFNSGRTPARNVHASTSYKVSPVPVSGPSREDINTLTFRAVQSIAPQGRYNQLIGQLLPSGDVSTPDQRRDMSALVLRLPDIKAKRATLHYFGILKYDDVFGNHHMTEFCMFLADPESKKLGICDAFNDLN